MTFQSFSNLVVLLNTVLINARNRAKHYIEIMPKYYAVANGRNNGVYNSWDECKSQVDGYSKARYKSFSTRSQAEEFVNGSNTNSHYSSKPYSTVSTNMGYKCLGSYFHSDLKPQRDVPKGPVVYTDGACSRNGYKGAVGGIGVYWGDNNADNVSEPLFGRQTNNRAEIMAAVRAVSQAKVRGHKELTIRTDSNFMKQAVEEWVPKWKRNGWLKSDGQEVVNKEDFEELERVSQGMVVRFEKVAAHKGIHGNEMADRLANIGMNKRNMTKRDDIVIK